MRRVCLSCVCLRCLSCFDCRLGRRWLGLFECGGMGCFSHGCWRLSPQLLVAGLWLRCVCFSRGCVVSALRLSGSTADLSTGVSESTRCELGRPTTRRSRRLLLSAGVICVLMLCVSWVELVWVGSGWFGLSCWVVESRVDAMCGCLRSASASAWGCGAVCGAYCASPWVVCCVQDDCLVLSCRVRLSRV